MDINNLASDDGESVFYDPLFRVMIESHLTYLREHSGTKVFPLDPFLTYKHESDLYGLLDAIHVEKQFQYIVMRLNHMRTPCELDHGRSSLLIPDVGELNTLKNVFQTRNSPL